MLIFRQDMLEECYIALVMDASQPNPSVLSHGFTISKLLLPTTKA
jgi:hypothetical protein